VVLGAAECGAKERAKGEGDKDGRYIKDSGGSEGQGWRGKGE